MSALDQFKEFEGDDEECPLERLRFLCSLALSGQDWIDVEPFFDDIQKLIGKNYVQNNIKIQQ